MASNVFGTPVTDETLKGLPKYYDHQKAITQQDRAQMALEMKNAEGKDDNARKMAEYLCDRFQAGVMTMGLIYNATGSPLTFVREYEWEGHLSESPYPTIFLNGQWGVFVHGRMSVDRNYSKAAVVYSGKNSNGQINHWCSAWANNIAAGGGDHNRVFVEVREEGHYNDAIKEPVRQRLDHACHDGSGSNKQLVCKFYDRYTYGAAVFGSVGDDKIAVVESIMTLPDACC